MTDDEIDGPFQAGTRDLAHAESSLRPPLIQIERRAQRRRRRSTIMRGTLVLACVAGLIGVIVATRGSETERVTIAGPSTSATGNTTPNKPTPTYPTPTVEPSRVMPWISTIVEPNTRLLFEHTLDASGVRNAPTCTLGDLFVTVAFGGAAGTEYANIRVRNQTTHPCFVQGSPYVRFIDGVGRTNGGYSPHRSPTDQRIILLPGSWAVVGLTPAGADHCGGPNGDAYAGTTTAAIAFGIDANTTRIVRSSITSDQPNANGCPRSPFHVSSAYTGPFEPIPQSPGNGMPSDVDLVFAPLHNGVAIDAPKQVRRGTTASYSITLTNTSLNSFVLLDDDCPLYRQSLGDTKSGTLLLNCGGPDGLIMEAGASVRFDMRLAVPADQPLGPTALHWQLVEPERPSLSARVTVVDSATRTTP